MKLILIRYSVIYWHNPVQSWHDMISDKKTPATNIYVAGFIAT